MTGTRSIIEATAAAALRASDVAEEHAGSVARSMMEAARDGRAIGGLSDLPAYCDHAVCGKVHVRADPVLAFPSAAGVRVDAGTVSHIPRAARLPSLVTAARGFGIGVFGIRNQYGCGSLGYFVEQLARCDLIGILVQPCCRLPPTATSAPFSVATRSHL